MRGSRVSWNKTIGGSEGLLVTAYAVERDHSTEMGFFRVRVRDGSSSDDGVGAQVYVLGCAVGVSITFRRRK